MEARASLRTLHPTITGKKFAAHAQSEAVGLVGTKELTALHFHDGHRVLMALPVVEPTLDTVQVHDTRMRSPAMCHLVDFLQPFHFTVAMERIMAQ